MANNKYGRFRPTRGRTEQAHRWGYEHHVGPIPEGLTLDHLCENTWCVNPEHLEPVTQQENHARHMRSRTRCKNHHLLSIAGTVVGAKGENTCAACKHISRVERKVRERAERLANPAPRVLKTHCGRGHAYAEGNEYWVPSTGKRACLSCKKFYSLNRSKTK